MPRALTPRRSGFKIAAGNAVGMDVRKSCDVRALGKFDMPKRKKRILFDVMGTNESPRRVEVARKKTARPVPVARPEEVRLSYSMAATFAVVFLVVVGLAYYLGHRQGAQLEGTPAALRKSTRTSPKSARTGDYAIRAKRVRFTSFTKKEAAAALLAHKKFLEDHDYRGVRVVLHTKGYDEGEGSLSLWVDRASSREELEPLADKLRILKDRRGRTPFASAFVLKVNP